MTRRPARSRRGLLRRFAVMLIAVVMAGTGLPLLGEGAAAAAQTLSAPALKTIEYNGSNVTVTWKKVSGCTGYQLQYATNRLFQKKQTKKVVGEKKKSLTITDVSGTCFVRIRAYQTVGDKTIYSPWTISSNAKVNKTLGLSVVRKLLKKFELRGAAGQKVPGYDTLQGSCYAKGYVYYLLENRAISTSKARCRIVKVKLSNLKVVKVSAPLAVCHGNDITYDTKRNRIVVAHSTPTPKNVSIVNPVTLKKVSTKTVTVPDYLEGMSAGRHKYYNGFGAIAYNAKHDRYAVLLRGANFHHIMLLNGKFKPVKFLAIDEDERARQVVQGIDSYDDFVLVSQSYKGNQPNNILVYDWEGRLLSKLNLGRTYELESIFHTGDSLYAGFYTSFYKKTLTKGYVLKRNNYLYKLSKY